MQQKNPDPKPFRILVHSKLKTLTEHSYFYSLPKNDSIKPRTILHIKLWLAQTSFWLGCPCCGYEIVKHYGMKIVDIDEQKYIGRFVRVGKLRGKRLAVVMVGEYVDWGQLRALYKSEDK